MGLAGIAISRQRLVEKKVAKEIEIIEIPISNTAQRRRAAARTHLQLYFRHCIDSDSYHLCVCLLGCVSLSVFPFSSESDTHRDHSIMPLSWQMMQMEQQHHQPALMHTHRVVNTTRRVGEVENDADDDVCEEQYRSEGAPLPTPQQQQRQQQQQDQQSQPQIPLTQQRRRYQPYNYNTNAATTTSFTASSLITPRASARYPRSAPVPSAAVAAATERVSLMARALAHPGQQRKLLASSTVATPPAAPALVVATRLLMLEDGSAFGQWSDGCSLLLHPQARTVTMLLPDGSTLRVLSSTVPSAAKPKLIE